MAATRVYVHNIPWDCTNEELANFMSTAGDVKMASIMTRHDGRSKGCAIVEYNTPEAAAHAISTLNDAEIKERKILVREDREVPGAERPAPAARAPRGAAAPRGAPRGRGAARGGRGGAAPRRPAAAGAGPVRTSVPGTSVYVGNLAWSVSWQDLKDAFSAYGANYADVKMTYDGRSKGWGIVRFDTPEAAAEAIANMQGADIKGRAVEVREDRGPSAAPEATA